MVSGATNYLCVMMDSGLDEVSRNTLRSVEQNDTNFTELKIGSWDSNINFDSRDNVNFSRLGSFVANNTNLTKLDVELSSIRLLSTDTEFYDGLNHNSSINYLWLWGYHCSLIGTNGGEVAQEILKVYQTNSNLTNFSVCRLDLHGGGSIIANTFSSCTNLKSIYLKDCNINNEQLLPMVEAIRGHCSLEQFSLPTNRIGNAGCELIATLLKNPHGNLCELQLYSNEIGIEGLNSLANGLANNTTLNTLILGQNPIDQDSLLEVLSNLLCDTTSVNSIYTSNHTLEDRNSNYSSVRKLSGLSSLMFMNHNPNKRHVAIKKILHYYPVIDMKPLFKLDGGGEDNLKALPLVVDWFNRAIVAVTDDIRERGRRTTTLPADVDKRKLSAIYQFSLAMPLLFVPSPSDMLSLHLEVRGQLEKKNTKLDREIARMLKAKKDLEAEINARDETIENIKHDMVKKRKM